MKNLWYHKRELNLSMFLGLFIESNLGRGRWAVSQKPINLEVYLMALQLFYMYDKELK